MNVLDENVPLEQRDLLRAWGIHCRMVGQDIARSSLGDDDILTLLHRLKQPTFFTRDEDFFDRQLLHACYSLVWLDVAAEEAALFIRRFLRHPRFATKAHRLWTIVRVHHDGLEFWERHPDTLKRLRWPRQR